MNLRSYHYTKKHLAINQIETKGSISNNCKYYKPLPKRLFLFVRLEPNVFLSSIIDLEKFELLFNDANFTKSSKIWFDLNPVRTTKNRLMLKIKRFFLFISFCDNRKI